MGAVKFVFTSEKTCVAKKRIAISGSEVSESDCAIWSPKCEAAVAQTAAHCSATNQRFRILWAGRAYCILQPVFVLAYFASFTGILRSKSVARQTLACFEYSATNRTYRIIRAAREC